jgi:putative ABC transport system substrate-binding protein
VQDIARSSGLRVEVLEVHRPEDLDLAFATLRRRPQAVIILPSPMIYKQSEQLAKLTIKYRIPATSMFRPFAEAGGAVAYGPDMASSTERAGILVAKILEGAKPAELPVERPTKVQLIVNLKSAKALGLTVPKSVLYRADEVIR